VLALDPVRRVAILDDMSERPYDLFLGVPKHCVPEVVAASGMTVDGWIPVDPKTLALWGYARRSLRASYGREV
jgi:sulfide:quinone oxidoreductase